MWYHNIPETSGNTPKREKRKEKQHGTNNQSIELRKEKKDLPIEFPDKFNTRKPENALSLGIATKPRFANWADDEAGVNFEI
jgi:hypothetical protein